MIGYSILLLVLLCPSPMLAAVDFKTACELLKLPRDCHCQRTRGVPLSSLNETRLRCRQLTEITTNHRWSIVTYDRLAFETPNDNLTVHRFAFADIKARSLRFDVQHLVLNDHTFDNAYLGQLAISRTDDFGTIDFQPNGQIFYGTTVTNIFIKSINFQRPISEIIFSNAKIYTMLIQSSKFFGFTNRKYASNRTDDTPPVHESQHDNFLEYDFMLTTSASHLASSSSSSSSPSSPLKIRRRKKLKLPRQVSESSDEHPTGLPEQTVTINITSMNVPAFVTIYTILSSINTSNLTETFFPNNIEYSQTDEIQLSSNVIHSIDAHAFRHLQFFEGRLILTNNQIHSLDLLALADLHSLHNLSLAHNLIQNLSSRHFQSLNLLHELDLSSNRIEQLNANLFQYLPHLHVLHLSGNPLRTIDADVFTNLNQLTEIRLQGVELIHLIDQSYTPWIWNLASLHVNSLLTTNFDLSDVAFCLLSRFNQTLNHLPRQYTCSCHVHYFYRHPDAEQNSSTSADRHPTNYLRLSPICSQNETTPMLQAASNETEPSNTSAFVLRGLDNQCDYQFVFLNCDAMTTTTTTTMSTMVDLTTMLDATTMFETSMSTTRESTVPTTTPWFHKYTKAPKKSVNNAKKLFIVLGTLIGITILAIILVILWYRLKAIFKRQQKKKKILEQQRHLNSPFNQNHNSSTPRYASSDILGSIHSTQLTGNKSQSQALIAAASAASPSSTVYQNVDVLPNDSIQNGIVVDDEENPPGQHQDGEHETLTTHSQAITAC